MNYGIQILENPLCTQNLKVSSTPSKQGLFVYGNDGNMNLYGNITKSILFGVCIYTIMKTTDYISSI